MQLKAIIVDDEAHCINTLRYELEENCPEVEAVASFSDPQSALDFMKKTVVDLLFLDIKIPGYSGFELLNEAVHIPKAVVFVTAFEEYALEALKNEAVDYLLKPVDGEDLRAAVDKVLKRNQDSVKVDAQLLADIHQAIHQRNDRISISTAKGLTFLPVADIIYCQSERNYTTFYTTNDESIIASKTLKTFEEVLRAHNFVRVHSRYLINSLHIKEYIREEGGYLVMSNGHQVSVSRNRKDQLKKLF